MFKSSDSILSVKEAGVYHVVIKDTVSLCANQDSFMLLQDQEQPRLHIEKPDYLSCIKPEIQLDASASDSGLKFKYLWSTTNGEITSPVDGVKISLKKAGDYQLQIENIENFCKTESQINIQEKTKPKADYISVTDGLKIELTSNSSGIPDLYHWDFGDGEQSIEKNPSHVYTHFGSFTICLNVENECGQDQVCKLIYINKPGVLNIAQAHIQPINCFGDSSGSILLTVEGGIAPYQFLWSNQQTTKDLLQVPAGMYQVQITDQAQSMVEKEFTLVQEDEIVVDQLTINPSSAQNNSGSIELILRGGKPPYTYHWSNGSFENPIKLLASGEYTLTLTDALSCVKHLGPYLVKEITEVSGQEHNILMNFYPAYVDKELRFTIKSDMDSQAIQVSVIDLMGVQRINQKFSNSGMKARLDVRDLSPGVYFFNIQSGQAFRSIKFIWY